MRDSLVLITEVADGVPSLMTVLDNYNKWTYDICENCSNWYWLEWKCYTSAGLSFFFVFMWPVVWIDDTGLLHLILITEVGK